MRNEAGSELARGKLPFTCISLFPKTRSPADACAAERGLGKERALKAIPVLSWGCASRFAETERGPIRSAC